MASPPDPEPVFIPPTTSSPTSPPTAPPTSPNISIRTFIYFLPHPLPQGTPIPYTPGLPSTNPLNLPPHAFEPTSTLVLTSPGKTFVDLRYLKAISATTTSDEKDSDADTNTNTSTDADTGVNSRDPVSHPGAALPSKTLDWGFCGSSSSVPAPSAHDIYGAYTENKWTHWVDSRYAVGERIPADEGFMFEVGEGKYVEHGHAFHPGLGRVAGHEEGWVDGDVRAVEPRSFEGSRGGDGEEGKVSIVLRCHDDEKGVRGVVVRVGQYVQGIVQVRGEVTTERWEYDFESGGWKRTVRTGEWFLPCAVTWQTGRVVVGGKVRFGEFEWVVEEFWVW